MEQGERGLIGAGVGSERQMFGGGRIGQGQARAREQVDPSGLERAGIDADVEIGVAKLLVEDVQGRAAIVQVGRASDIAGEDDGDPGRLHAFLRGRGKGIAESGTALKRPYMNRG